MQSSRRVGAEINRGMDKEADEGTDTEGLPLVLFTDWDEADMFRGDALKVPQFCLGLFVGIDGIDIGEVELSENKDNSSSTKTGE